MPRTRKTPRQSANPNPPTRQGGNDGAVIWVNIKLNDDDVAYLTEQPASYEELGAMLLTLGDEGYNFSVKSMEGGESIMCAITGFAVDDPSRSMGVSAFASNVTDAVLAALYKFDTKLGRRFDTTLGATASVRPRFR